MKASKGPQRRTRSKLRKSVREKGKIRITNHLQQFEVGEKVLIKVDPSVQKGRPYKRFFGKIGKVVGRRGNAYEVEVKDIKKLKTIIALPVHLKRMS